MAEIVKAEIRFAKFPHGVNHCLSRCTQDAPLLTARPGQLCAVLHAGERRRWRFRFAAGSSSSSIVQNQFNWGYEGIRILTEYLADGIVPDEFVETKCYACTKELAEQNYPNVNPE